MTEQRSKRPLPARPEGSYHPAPSVDGVIAGGFIFLGALRGKGDTTEVQARSAFETLKSLGESPSTKWIFPMEFTSMLGNFMSMGGNSGGSGNGDRQNSAG